MELYPLNPTIKRAVERSVEIAGEAVRQLRQLDDSIASAISDARKIVDVRTILAHGYRKFDPDIILSIVRVHLSLMRHEVDALRAPEPL